MNWGTLLTGSVYGAVSVVDVSTPQNAAVLAKGGNGYHNQQWYLMLNAVQASMHTPEQKRQIALLPCAPHWNARTGT